MEEPTQKEIAEFFGITENTVTNWKKTTNRHRLFGACKFYLIVGEKAELYKEVLEQIYDSIEMIDSEKSFVVEGKKISFKDLGKRNLNDSKEKLKELSEILNYATQKTQVSHKK